MKPQEANRARKLAEGEISSLQVKRQWPGTSPQASNVVPASSAGCEEGEVEAGEVIAPSYDGAATVQSIAAEGDAGRGNNAPKKPRREKKLVQA